MATVVPVIDSGTVENLQHGAKDVEILEKTINHEIHLGI